MLRQQIQSSRSRGQDSDLRESNEGGAQHLIGRSELYVGRSWAVGNGGKAYSALRVDISEGRPLQILLTPLISSRQDQRWQEVALDPIALTCADHRVIRSD